MFQMYESKNSGSESLGSYGNVFKSINLSLLRLKKEQCSLCMIYNEGDAGMKAELEDKYQ